MQATVQKLVAGALLIADLPPFAGSEFLIHPEDAPGELPDSQGRRRAQGLRHPQHTEGRRHHTPAAQGEAAPATNPGLSSLASCFFIAFLKLPVCLERPRICHS